MAIVDISWDTAQQAASWEALKAELNEIVTDWEEMLNPTVYLSQESFPILGDWEAAIGGALQENVQYVWFRPLSQEYGGTFRFTGVTIDVQDGAIVPGHTKWVNITYFGNTAVGTALLDYPAKPVVHSMIALIAAVGNMDIQISAFITNAGPFTDKSPYRESYVSGGSTIVVRGYRYSQLLAGATWNNHYFVFPLPVHVPDAGATLVIEAHTTPNFSSSAEALIPGLNILTDDHRATELELIYVDN